MLRLMLLMSTVLVLMSCRTEKDIIANAHEGSGRHVRYSVEKVNATDYRLSMIITGMTERDLYKRTRIAMLPVIADEIGFSYLQFTTERTNIWYLLKGLDAAGKPDPKRDDIAGMAFDMTLYPNTDSIARIAKSSDRKSLTSSLNVALLRENYPMPKRMKLTRCPGPIPRCCVPS